MKYKPKKCNNVVDIILKYGIIKLRNILSHLGDTTYNESYKVQFKNRRNPILFA